MATKTITLEIDAYEKLRLSIKSGESFSEVIRPASFPDSVITGAGLRKYFQQGGSGVSEQYLDAIETAARNDSPPRKIQPQAKI